MMTIFLKRPLCYKITCKILNNKMSLKFLKFDGSQDANMYVHKLQEEAIEFVHNHDMLAKLFSHCLKDGELKWYFTILEKSIDSYEYLIYLFIENFTYNIKEQELYKDLCIIKLLSNPSLTNFLKV